MFVSPGPIAFQIGPFAIRWYGILMATAIGVGFWLAYRRARAEDLPADEILSVALGQAIGRWGNFFNEEAFGQPTDLPWKLYISPAHRPPGYEQFEYFHPTFLYESIWDLGIFLVLTLWLRPRLRPRPGALFFC